MGARSRDAGFARIFTNCGSEVFDLYRIDYFSRELKNYNSNPLLPSHDREKQAQHASC